jgi:Carboxypeptidase regulatory-like domain/TonB dependent receptor
VLRKVGAAAFCLVLFVVPLFAQNPRGSVRGTVQDATGARITSAKIVVHSIASSIERGATSESNGEFRLDDLLPGAYRVTVTAPGFPPAQAEVAVAVSEVRDVTVTLKLAAGSETVNVQATTSSITTNTLDTTDAVRGGVVGSQDLETMPLPARSFANIAYLVPGTEPVEPSDPTKARITAVSTGGSSGLNNELSVDGAENSDDWIGGFLQNFSPDGVQEFAVRTSNEEADTGWTTAGSVVITTKRGTNDWHGSGALFDRQAALNARFPIENPAQSCTNGVCVNNPKQPFSRQNYVGTIGGPIAHNKVWVFTTFEGVHEDASIAYSDPSITQFDALAQLASDGLIAGMPSITVPQNVPIPFRDYLGSTRFDWAQSPKSNWFLRTSEDSYTTHNALVQQGTLPSTGLLTHNNYWNVALSNTYTFSPTWLGNLVIDASLLHLTQTRNSNFGFALAFPFSSTALTISGFETYGDNQFATPITLFPDLRNQDKYQFRYDLTHVRGTHAFKFGVDFIHEPVLSGAFASTAETVAKYVNDPTFYVQNLAAFGTFNPNCSNFATDGSTCTQTPTGDGSFSQNVQRLGLYAEDSWRVSRQLTVNYGLRYQTTWGLFLGSGRSEAENPAYLTLQALQIPVVPSVPQDYHKQIAPRLGIAYSPGQSGKTVIHAGFGLYYDDLAQNGWATAFQGVNDSNAITGTCSLTGGVGTYALSGTGCLQGGSGATGNLVGSPYKTPYAIHITGGVQHAFNEHWLMSADYVHEQGNHGYRGFPYTSCVPAVTPPDSCVTPPSITSPLIPASDPNYATDQANVVPNVNVFESDNRSSYNGLLLHLQGNTHRFDLVANYNFSKAQTWGCLLGELFDYVDGVCPNQPNTPNAGLLNAFGAGDYGPSGEDVRHRVVLAGTLHLPGGFELSTINQFESPRPITITNANNTDRIYVQLNGGQPQYTSLDIFRGRGYMQSDMRVTRPFKINERWRVDPFIEFFNLFNRNNPGANYAVNVVQLPVPQAQMQSNALGETIVSSFCPGGSPNTCTQTASVPITSLKQLEIPEGALGDFFGPGTTVGIPFAAQLGVRVTF